MKKEFADIRNLYQNLYESNLEESVQDLHERPRSQAVQNYLNRKKGEQDLNNKVDKFKQENPGTDFSRGAKMSNPNLTPSSSFNNNNKTSNNNNNNKPVVNNNSGAERTVTQNQDGKGITITKKDLDSETDELIANTPVKGKNSNNEKINNNNKQIQQPKNDEKPLDTSKIKTDNKANKQDLAKDQNQNSSGSGSVKVSGDKLRELLPNHPDNKKQGGPDRSGTQNPNAEKAKYQGGPDRSGTQPNPEKSNQQTQQPQTNKTDERQAWLDKTSNSPAAKAGLSDDQRWAARQKNQEFKQDNNRGEFSKDKQTQQPQPETQVAQDDTKTQTVGGQGNKQRQVKTGGIQLGKSIRGGLRGLGNLAARGLDKAKTTATNVGNTIQKGVNTAANTIQKGVNTAGNVLNKGVEAGKRVVGGTADAVTGNLTDFDRRGGETKGLARVVTGGIDKVTGDRTDLDRKGVTPLNQGQKNQLQQNKPVVQQNKPVVQQNKPVVQQNKPVVQQNKPVVQQNQQQRPSPMERRNRRMERIKARGNPRLQAQIRMRQGTNVNKLFNSYEPTEDLFDATAEFLISEGYAQNLNEAISIMAEPEFREGFDEGMEQILNESSENNK